MPLWNRFQTELQPEWRKECVNYRDLKRTAEALVGEDTPENRRKVLATLGNSLEKTSVLYCKHERKLCKFFCSLSSKLDTTVSENCEKGAAGEEGGQANASRSTADLIQQDSAQHFVGALLAFLVHVDSLRTFALLNSLAVLRIARHHCTKEIGGMVLQRLYSEPFYACLRLTSLIEEISALSARVLSLFFSAPPAGPLIPDDDQVLMHGGKMLTCEELSTFCTYTNLKGMLPAWVCQSICTNSAMHTSELRNVRVTTELSRFMKVFSARLEQEGLEHLLPGLMRRVGGGGGAAVRKPGPPPVQQSHNQVQSTITPPAKAPANALPMPAQNRSTNAETPKVVSNVKGWEPACGLRLQRTCRDLRVLACDETDIRLGERVGKSLSQCRQGGLTPARGCGAEMMSCMRKVSKFTGITGDNLLQAGSMGSK